MRILSGTVRIYSILVRINIHILQPLSPRPQLLRRGTTVSRTPLVAASDSHTRRSHTHVPRPASRPCRRPRATCTLATRAPTGGEISTNITRRSPRPGHGVSTRPRAPFTSVMPNIYEYKRTKCGRIDRAHLIRYCTHIQHTRANKYSYPSAVVPAPSTPPPRHYCLPHAVANPLLAYPRTPAGPSFVRTPFCNLTRKTTPLTCHSHKLGSNVAPVVTTRREEKSVHTVHHVTTTS